MGDRISIYMKRLLKNISKALIVILVFTTLLINTNVVFCDDDKTLTISYTCTVKVTATFIDDLTNEITTQEHDIGDMLIEPSHSNDSNYRFLGWYLDGTKWDFDNGTIHEDITLHGKYKKKLIPTFDIPNTGIDAIDSFIETVETNRNVNNLVLIVLLILIIVTILIIIFMRQDKDDIKTKKTSKIIKFFKNIFVVTLCAVLVINSTDVYAEEDNGSKYEVIVPSAIMVNEVNSFEIKAKADFALSDGKPVDNFIITCDDKVTLIKAGNDSITYEVSIFNTFKDFYSKDDINQISVDEYSTLGSISYDLPITKFAGTYIGTLTFTYYMKTIDDNLAKSLLTKNNIKANVMPTDFEYNSIVDTNDITNIYDNSPCSNAEESKDSDCDESVDKDNNTEITITDDDTSSPEQEQLDN